MASSGGGGKKDLSECRFAVSLRSFSATGRTKFFDTLYFSFAVSIIEP